MKIQDIVKIAALTLMAAALMPIRANANPGDIYVSYNGHAAIRGTIYDYAPNGIGRVFASRLNGPRGITFDGAGNVYVADAAAGVVYKFTGTLSTFASVPAAFGLAFDSAGNLFVSTQCEAFPAGDCTDPTIGGRIVKITPSGIQTTFASGLGDGDLRGLAFDALGNLFVADLGLAAGHDPSRAMVLKITPTGLVSVFASGVSNAEFVTVQP